MKDCDSDLLTTSILVSSKLGDAAPIISSRRIAIKSVKHWCNLWGSEKEWRVNSKWRANEGGSTKSRFPPTVMRYLVKEIWWPFDTKVLSQPFSSVLMRWNQKYIQCRLGGISLWSPSRKAWIWVLIILTILKKQFSRTYSFLFSSVTAILLPPGMSSSVHLLYHFHGSAWGSCSRLDRCLPCHGWSIKYKGMKI